MKMKLYGALLTGALALGAQAQQQPTNTTDSSSRNLPPGLERREQLPPGLEKRETLPPGLEKRQPQETQTPVGEQSSSVPQQYGTNDSFSSGWNRAGTNMARFGTNAYLGASNAWTSLSNQFKARTQEVEPTSDRGSTNRVYATNNASATSTTTIKQDQAVTATDRKLLVNIRQEIQPILVNIGSSADVHFISRQGTVTIVGFVPSEQESRRIVEVVQRTPGVTRVVNQIRVGSHADVNVGGTTVVRQDQAFTPADQRLLVTVREEIQPVLVTVPSANVYFKAQQGVVTLLGVVPSQQESQRILEIVQRTPGVVRVVNQIQVNAQSSASAGAGSQSAAVGTTNQFQSTNAFGLTQTNRGTSELGGTTSITNTNTLSAGTSTTNENVSTNLSPTGRTNTTDRVSPDSDDQKDENLPPGLRKRETLPPGLEKRDQLPPGLEKRDQESK
jgi:osmotically-inducible protein OsmY